MPGANSKHGAFFLVIIQLLAEKEEKEKRVTKKETAAGKTMHPVMN